MMAAMFLTPENLESVAAIIARGFIVSACVIGGSIVLAKLIEIIGVRRLRRKDRRNAGDRSRTRND